MTLYSIHSNTQQDREKFVRLLPPDSRLISYGLAGRRHRTSFFYVDTLASRETMEAAYPSTDGWTVEPDAVTEAIIRIWRHLDFDWEDPDIHDMDVTSSEVLDLDIDDFTDENDPGP
jgi:hypothetical protein